MTSSLQLAVLLALVCHYASCDEPLRPQPPAVRQAADDPLVVELQTVREPDFTSHDPLIKNLIQGLGDIQHHMSRATDSMSHLVSQLDTVLNTCTLPTSERCVLSLQAPSSPGVSGQAPSSQGVRAQGSITRRRRSLRGYRSMSSMQRLDNHLRLLQDLQRKRDILRQHLMAAHGTNDIIKSETKRSCDLNLGFHCLSEDIEKFSDLYDFINSVDSPGKRAV